MKCPRNASFLSFCLIIFTFLLLVPCLVLASVSAHYVPTVCNGREIVDSTTSSLWPHTVHSLNLPLRLLANPWTLSPFQPSFPASYTLYTFIRKNTYTDVHIHTQNAHTQKNKQPSLWTRTVLFHKCRKCVTIIKLFSRDVHTWNRHCCK